MLQNLRSIDKHKRMNVNITLLWDRNLQVKTNKLKVVNLILYYLTGKFLIIKVIAN